MSKSIQYIINEQGERVGVLLDLPTYRELTNLSTADAEILTGLSLDELQALAESTLSLKAQVQLDDLLVRNAENKLSADETATLDHLLAQVDQLNILKTRAKYTLKHFDKTSEVA
ncbi:hypothetical protein WA1_42485 [Scytonema hofmannii PCC 7110]|uniref:Uncharacterized protein n=1 Tax=Scytonema hofmannii PCC 7110 TaxID=128403 RepID=A0A139WVC1_9CYAN|nr:hypothetical protein [Scytonema hofmannii]KYC36381.1 hypothetical protein WA1_42485 [Scytonema hofmannii PCC 7110]